MSKRLIYKFLEELGISSDILRDAGIGSGQRNHPEDSDKILYGGGSRTDDSFNISSIVPKSDDESIIEKILGPLASMFNQFTGAHLTGAQKEQNAYNAEQAAINRGFEERMSNTAYQRALNDMQNAGLNPALMFGNGSAGSTPSGSAASGSAGSGDMSSLLSLLIGFKQLKQQKMISDRTLGIEEYKAKTGRIQADADASKKIKETEWIDRLNQIKLDTLDIQNNLTKEQIQNTIQQRDLVVKEIDNITQSIKESQSRVLLNRANEWLSKASVKEILTMMPYNIALSEARTEAEEAAAFLDWINHAKEVRLLDSSYYDSLISEAGFSADAARISAERGAYDYVLRTGQGIKTKVGKSLFHGLQNFGAACQGLGAPFGLATGVAVAKIRKNS